jgi:hypothetical protein
MAGDKLFEMIAQLSRRQMLVGGAAAAGVVGLGGLTWVATSSPRELVYQILEHALPGVTLDRESCLRCAEDVLTELDKSFVETHGQLIVSYVKRKIAAAINGVIGIERLSELGPVEEQIDKLTRRALTVLLLNSNFFRVPDPTAVTIVYEPLPEGTPCASNLFVDLSLPSS